MDERPRPLLFNHVPKTAGTSVRRLAERYTPDAVHLYEGELALGNPNFDFIERFRAKPPPPLVIGHFSYGAHRLLGVAPRYACVLREPVGRVVSVYRMMQRLGDKSPHAEFFRANGSLHDFVGSCITEHTNNHVTRICAGVPPDAGMLLKERWLLDYALHNLGRNYVLIGLIECLPPFIAGLARLLNWPADAQAPLENVGPGGPPALSETTRKLIEDHNALDIALYETVRSGAAGTPLAAAIAR